MSEARFPLPEFTARVDGWPVSITRQHGPCWRARVSTSRVDGPWPTLQKDFWTSQWCISYKLDQSDILQEVYQYNNIIKSITELSETWNRWTKTENQLRLTWFTRTVDTGITSKAYIKISKQAVRRRCRTTTSDVNLPHFAKIALQAR